LPLICFFFFFFFLCIFTVRTPATKKYFNVYKQTMPADYNVVEKGGWSALEERATCELAYTKMEAMRPYLASDFNITKAGGWELLQQMAADPKGVLIQYIQHLARSSSNSNTNDKNSNNNINSRSLQLSRVKSVFDREDAVRPIPPDYLEGIRALLYAQGKGFDAQLVGTYTDAFNGAFFPFEMRARLVHVSSHSFVLIVHVVVVAMMHVEGEWILVLQQKQHASPKASPPTVERKLCDADNKDVLSFSNFDRARSLITGNSRFWKNLGTVNFELRYKTNPSKFSTRGSSVVFRRISCDVVENKVKLLGSRIPFKSRKSRGYSSFLDFVYLDEEIRMTVNEQGDLFVHARPDAIQRLFCD
jgi:hypothetical protein